MLFYMLEWCVRLFNKVGQKFLSQCTLRYTVDSVSSKTDRRSKRESLNNTPKNLLINSSINIANTRIS